MSGAGAVTAVRASFPPIVTAEGGYFTVADGRRFMDLAAQTLNLAWGQRFPPIGHAVSEQAGRVEFASSRFGTEPFVALCERLAGVAPAGIDAVAAKLTNGSDAVETAVKLALLHTRRRHVAVLPGAWHGESFLTLGMATTHRGRLLAEPGVAVAAEEPDLLALAQLVASRRDLAAAVIDPAMVAHGLPAGDVADGLGALRAACDATGTLLVTDEVQSFGWLGGHLFASEWTGVRPDIICLGKALGAGYPLAAVLARRDLMAVLQYNDAEFTGGGHPVSCAAALAGLDQLCASRDDLAARVATFTTLLNITFDPGFEVRQAGLIATVTPRSPRLRETWAAQATAGCADAGVFVRTTDLGRRLLIKPPHVLSPDDLHDGLAMMAHIGTGVAAGLDAVVPMEEARATGFERGVVRRTLRPNPHEAYVGALLRAAGLQVLTRSPRAQHDLTAALARLGVPVTVVYPAEASDAADYGWIPGRPLHTVLADPGTDPALINGLALRHYELVVRAHDHGLVIGDRWPGNAVVTARSEVVLIDFEIGYDGPRHDAALFEEAFTILQTLVAIPAAHPVRENLGERLTDALVDRHGIARAAAVWQRLSDFYLDPARPVHLGSDSASAYAGILWAALSRLEPQTRPCPETDGGTDQSCAASWG
ncbi:aminotransferase class III-fold pyridoxal phosphate-dependent enzyme [Nocardia wallacei]|uniref:aminotransferase class III-fold pyridoxal phosphate-dependent enzyme n=1 Tax=Nocardia wallacei TaxID=480035 RepID=UPI002454E868|nr:aminotransferase class III-fold pyridoxal phosphate-dependent enzyme [Nocardia wallacei]